MGTSVRTRFAPSPTGYLHVGAARTALFNWLFTRQSGGSVVLRVDDTDRTRSSAVYEEALVRDLEWLGLTSDEGPDKPGSFGPYRQSERAGLYKEYAAKLFKKGAAYRCQCTKQRLDELKKRLVAGGLPPRYDGKCSGLGLGEPPGDVPTVLRFRVPERSVVFTDGIHGKLVFDSINTGGDFIIMDSSGSPTYNFAVVVDDALMQITHVMRGDDHLSNTPRQILLFEAMGFAPPKYFHLPLLVGPDRTPLGKRHASASVRELRRDGYLPEAVINAVARLGWSPGEAFMGLGELAETFDPDRLSSSPSVFDPAALKRFNKQAIAKADDARLAALVRPFLKDASGAGGVVLDEKLIHEIKDSAATIKELAGLVEGLVGDPALTDEAREYLAGSGPALVVRALKKIVEGSGDFGSATYDAIVKRLAGETGASGRDLFLPVRAVLTGRLKGIELKKVFHILGRAGVLERLAAAAKAEAKRETKGE